MSGDAFANRCLTEVSTLLLKIAALLLCRTEYRSKSWVHDSWAGCPCHLRIHGRGARDTGYLSGEDAAQERAPDLHPGLWCDDVVPTFLRRADFYADVLHERQAFFLQHLA